MHIVRISFCARIQFVLIGDWLRRTRSRGGLGSSLLRLMADSFGMTTSIGLIGRGSSGDSLNESPLLPLMPPKILSFRAEAQSEAKGQARNLMINCFEIIIDNRYS
jgi:hypothetical protein